MKKSMLAIALLLIAKISFAATPTCNLPYDLAEEKGVNELRTLSIDEKTKLTSLQALQVVTLARTISDIDEDTIAKSLKQAIADLKDNSEGSELNYIVFEFRGVVYSEVEYYPGGNPVGMIFVGTKLIAERQDGDIVCAK